MIVFEAQHVMGSGLVNHLGDLLLCSHGVDGDNRAFDGQLFQKLGDCGDFVAFLVDLHLPQNQVVGRGPGIDQVNGLVFGRTAQGLAVDGDEFTAVVPAQTLGPLDEEVVELLGIDQTEDIAKGVVGRNAVVEIQMLLEPRSAGLPKLFKLSKRVGSRKHGAQGDEENFAQGIVSAGRSPRVGHLLQLRCQSFLRSVSGALG